MNVLVAEEFAGIGDLIKRVLSRKGCTVTCVTNEEALFHCVEEETFALIFVSATLPPNGGYATLERLRELTYASNPHFAILWQKMSIGEVNGQFQPGGDFYFRKPFYPGELETLVATIRDTL